jgi:hypothetical protein
MKPYRKSDGYIVIRKHMMALIIKALKSVFFIFIALVLYYYSYKYVDVIKKTDWLNIIAFLIIFFMIHYSFIKMILYIIYYYNDLVIMERDQIIILKSSLILIDDMEIIDIYKIVKMDSFSHWFFWNILWYWSIVIEQQKNEVRTFHFISDPHRMLDIFKKQKEEFKTKKYVQV